MLGSFGNALTLLLIAGVSLSFPPLDEFLKNFGAWTHYLWNLIPYFEVSEFTAKVLTVLTITVLVFLRGLIAKHPSLPKVLKLEQKPKPDKEERDEVEDISLLEVLLLAHRTMFEFANNTLGRILGLISLLFWLIILADSFKWLPRISPPIREGALYIAILSSSFYYPRAFFALLWAAGFIFLANFAGNALSPLLENGPWN